MAPFGAKIGGNTMRKGQNKNYHFVPFRSGAEQKRQKKKKKKKNTITASFQAKIVFKRPTKAENKNYRFVLFLHDALQKIPKKKEKIQKINKMPLWLHFKPKSVENG